METPVDQVSNCRDVESTADVHIRNLVNIKFRLSNGKHLADLCHNERCNINRQLPQYSIKGRGNDF